MPTSVRTVVVLVYPGVQLLDVAGPLDVFAAANALSTHRAGWRAYAPLLVSADGGPVRTSSGLTIAADRSFRALPGHCDTLLVPGAPQLEDVLRSRQAAFARRAAALADRIVSVCSGAFLLAETGLLDGLRATTHWAGCRELARRYPKVDVQPDRIYVRDGALYTSAGVTAGMDLALALVAEDGGADLALRTARWLVLYLRRSGGQTQFSAHLRGPLAEVEPIREVQGWIQDHPAADLRVEALARRAGVCPRHFARTFATAAGTTPARFVASVRLEAARRALEHSRAPLKTIAAGAGYASLESLRRAFHRALGTTPGDYRRHFQTASRAERPRRERRRRTTWPRRSRALER